MLPVLPKGVGQVRGHVILSYKIVLVFSTYMLPVLLGGVSQVRGHDCDLVV